MSARSNEGHGASMENGKLDTPEDGGADTTCNRKSHLEPGGERKHGRVTAGNTREATKNKQKRLALISPLLNIHLNNE